MTSITVDFNREGRARASKDESCCCFSKISRQQQLFQKFKKKKKRFLKPKVSQMHIFLSRRYISKGEISFSSKREMWRGAILRISFNVWICTLFPFGGIFPRNPKPPGRKKQWGFYSFLKNSIKNLKMKKNDKKKNENLKKRDRGRVEITSFLPPRESRNHEIHVSF